MSPLQKPLFSKSQKNRHRRSFKNNICNFGEHIIKYEYKSQTGVIKLIF